MRRRLAIAVTAAFLTLGGPIAGWAKTPANALVVAKNIDDIVSLDPAQAYEFTSGEVVANLYDRLVEYDPAHIETLRPALADSWTVSEDGRTLTFRLRPGAKFASGNPVRPEDVVFSFERVIKLKKAPSFILAQFGWTAQNVGELVRKTGDGEVAITVKETFAPTFILNALAARVGSIVDEKEANRNSKDGDLGNAWLSRNSAGSGPFTLRVWRPGEAVVLAANPTTFRGAPKVAQIIFNHVAEPSTQRLLLEAGDADMARNLGPDQIEAVRANPGLRVDTYPQAVLHFLSLNLKHEKLRDPALAEAMRYLIDYDGIADKLLRGQMKVHQAFWPSGFAGAVDEVPFSLDVERAKQILAKAGLSSSMTIDMDVIGSAPFTDVAQAIQSTMAQAGIKLNILPGTAAQVITKYRARQHQAMLLYWGPDFMDPHSNAKAFAFNQDNSDTNPQSTTTWRNAWAPAELSAMTQAALVERDSAKRLDMYRELQRRVMREAPWAIAFQAQAQVASRAEVKGFIHGPTADFVLYRDVSKN